MLLHRFMQLWEVGLATVFDVALLVYQGFELFLAIRHYIAHLVYERGSKKPVVYYRCDGKDKKCCEVRAFASTSASLLRTDRVEASSPPVPSLTRTTFSYEGHRRECAA